MAFNSEIEKISKEFSGFYDSEELSGRFDIPRRKYMIKGFADDESFRAWLESDEEFFSDCLDTWWPWHAAGAAYISRFDNDLVLALKKREIIEKPLKYIGSSLGIFDYDKMSLENLSQLYMRNVLQRAKHEIEGLRETQYFWIREIESRVYERFKDYESRYFSKMTDEEKSFFEELSQ